MPGYFSYPFDDDEVTGFFGGYRRPRPAADDNSTVRGVSDQSSVPASPRADILTYADGKPVIMRGKDQALAAATMNYSVGST